MIAVYKKELKSYFLNMTGFVFVSFLLLVVGIFTTVYNLILGYASFAYPLGSVEIVFLLIIPILTMRTIAEEKRSRTDQLLYSLPIPMKKIVLAKYFAMLTVFLIPLSIMALYPLMLSAFGSVPYRIAYASLLGFFLLGASLIAICMFLSSLTESQIIAAVLSFGVLLLFLLLPTLVSLIPGSAGGSLFAFLLLELFVAVTVYLLSHSLPVSLAVGGVLTLPTIVLYLMNQSLFAGLFPNLLKNLALFSRYEAFTSGIFDLTSIVFFLSVIVFFVFLTVQSVEKKRWN